MSGSSSTGVHPSGDATTTINLPLPSNLLFLKFTGISGPTMSGSLEVATSHGQPNNAVAARVNFHFSPPNIYEGCKAELVHRGEGESGVEVSVSDWVRHQHDARLSVEMLVTLPEPSGLPLVIKKFETNAGNVSQKVGTLKDKVLFQSLTLKGTNGDIHVGSLKADQGRIETSNGVIHGEFYASKELTISTSNGNIQADIGLASIWGSKPTVSMSSTNGNIGSNISLASSSGSAGSFGASATSHNGHMDIKFISSPLNSTLNFVGENKNGDVNVSLNPAYEGAFTLKSRESNPTVNVQEQTEDPSGKNRKRVVSKTEEKHSITGGVYWEDPGVQSKAEGTVDAHTKNGKAVLTL